MDSTFCCLRYRNAIIHKLAKTTIVAIACIAWESHNRCIVEASNNIWSLDLTLFAAFAFDEAVIKILSMATETIGFALMEFKWIQRDYRKDFHFHRMPMPNVYASFAYTLFIQIQTEMIVKSKNQNKNKKNK